MYMYCTRILAKAQKTVSLFLNLSYLKVFIFSQNSCYKVKKCYDWNTKLPKYCNKTATKHLIIKLLFHVNLGLFVLYIYKEV